MGDPKIPLDELTGSILPLSPLSLRACGPHWLVQTCCSIAVGPYRIRSSTRLYPIRL